MILKQLRVQMMDYGLNKGSYKGEASFTGDSGTVALNLTKEQCDQILEMCADSIIKAAHQQAQVMTRDVLEHKPLNEKREPGEL